MVAITAKASVAGERQPRQAEIDDDSAQWAEDERLIFFCEDCQSFHLDPNNIGPENEPASWTRFRRLIAKAKGGA